MIGGSIESVSLAGRAFAVPSDNDVTVSIGGFNNDNQMNGDGTNREIKTRMAWKLTGLQIAYDADTDDDLFLQNLADGSPFTVAITYASGAVRNGTGGINGEVTFSTQSSTARSN